MEKEKYLTVRDSTLNDVVKTKHNIPKKLVLNNKRRTLKEILDMNDYYYRLHWAAAVELRSNNKTKPYIDEEIIMERHYALNWLIKYMKLEWDDVTADT